MIEQQVNIVINNKGIWKGNENLFSFTATTVGENLLDAYKNFQLDYPKFHKMDNLCKVGMLGVELLLENSPELKNFPDKENQLGLIFHNSVSSLDTDVKHQESISNTDKSVSPAIFVYTLPNIVLGELAIKHKWYGENMFCVEKEFNREKIEEQAKIWFELEKASACIIAWIDVFKNEINASFEVCYK